jgi:glycerophosphoryl diester phosphodiesterase
MQIKLARLAAVDLTPFAIFSPTACHYCLACCGELRTVHCEAIMRKAALKKSLIVAIIVGGGALYLVNASWLASPPTGRPTLIAQRGVHQVYGREAVDDATCTARRIPPPSHLFIDNTLPSIAAAFALGATVVEIDVRQTKDRQFVLFHDAALECRTNGTGWVAEHTLAELQALDVGYGYTADNGNTFPLRGRGGGLMPSLADALLAYPHSRFLIQFKDADPLAGRTMVAYLEDHGLAEWSRLTFFGSARPLSRLASLKPEARAWSAGSTARCIAQYLELGWMGHVPKACDDGIIMVPITQSGFVWGWPNRFLERMRKHHTEVMLIGGIDGLSGANFWRLDTLEEFKRVPPGFDGAIWTDRIEVLGPALSPTNN